MTKLKAPAMEEAAERYDAALPERLRRLNRELAVERVKDFDYVYAVSGEYRFKVAVFRNGGHGFSATAKAAGHVHRYDGDTPSTAFLKLVRSLRWVVSRMEFEKNTAIYQLSKSREDEAA